MNTEKLEGFYNKNYKKLFLIPIVIFLIAITILVVQYSKTGDIFNRDVSLKGGVSATIHTDKVDLGLEEFLNSKFKDADILVRQLKEFGGDKQVGIVIEASDIKEEELKLALEERLGLELSSDNYSVEEVGSSLGASFYRQMIMAIVIAFILMGIVVFITFRALIPSLAVVFAALSDIVVTLAVIDVIGMRVSTAGIAALLLIIGYSVDTDVLLTTKLVKRKEGSIFERLKSAMKTGLTMTITTVAALTIGLFVTNSVVLKEMFLIIVVALIYDVIATYLMNAGLLVWYLERKEKRLGA